MTITTPTRRGAIWILVVAAALAARVAWFSVKGGMYFPDEIFQYLEPGHFRITGDAFLPWEFDVGARHWIIPAFWAGWIEIGRAFGLQRWELHRFLALHATLLSALVVPAVFRMVRASTRDPAVLGGAAGTSTGTTTGGAAVSAALLAAMFPMLGYFAPHTMSELPAMLLVAFAHASWLEISDGSANAVVRSRRAMLAGALLAAAAACRVPSLLSVPIIACDLFLRRRSAEGALRDYLVGFGVAAGALGVVDALTWGGLWHSVLAFVRSNLRYEDELARMSLSEPWHFYVTALWRTMGLAAPVLGLLTVLGARRHPRLLFAFWVPLVLMSVLRNKQDRFLVPLVPLLLASAACGVAEAARRLSRPISWRAALGVGVALSLLAFPAAARLPLRSQAGAFRAQAWIGVQPDAHGVLLDGGSYENGGYLLLDRSIPQVPFDVALVDHALFDYVIAFQPALLRRMADHPSFERVATFEEAAVFHRRAVHLR